MSLGGHGHGHGLRQLPVEPPLGAYPPWSAEWGLKVLDTHRLEAAVAAVALGSGLLAALEEGGERLFIALPTTPRRAVPTRAWPARFLQGIVHPWPGA